MQYYEKNNMRKIRDKIRLELNALTDVKENFIRPRFVFSPRDLVLLGIYKSYAAILINSNNDRGICYAYINFNMPLITDKLRELKTEEERTNFIKSTIYHEYRHYQQLKEIEELQGRELESDIVELMEADSKNYSEKLINENIEIPIDNIKKKIQKLVRKLDSKAKSNINKIKLV